MRLNQPGSSSVRFPTLALMTRRFPVGPTEASITLAGRFIRDTCRNWGVPDDLVGEAAVTVRALVEGAVLRGGAPFHLVVEARSHTVTVRIHTDDGPVPYRGPTVFAAARPWTAGAWTFVPGQEGDEVCAVVPRGRPLI
jgi:hypothetical protein